MEEIGQLRIYVPEQQFQIYHDLGNKLFQRNSQFFIYCVMVGKNKGTKQQVSNKHELCRAVTLSEHEWTVLNSVYYDDEKDLGTYKEITTKAEEYANGGFEWLMKNEFSDCVHYEEGYLLTESKTEFQLKLIDYTLNHENEFPF